VGAELLHVDRVTDMKHLTNLTVCLHKFAKVSKNDENT
jgi:hypothetical protein